MKNVSWVIALVVGLLAGWTLGRFTTGRPGSGPALGLRPGSAAPTPPAPQGPPPVPPTTAAKIALRADDPARGPEGATITVAVFSDFQCPFCSRVEPTLRQAQQAYPGLRVVWKHFPLGFHPNAMPAAVAAEAAREQGKFWEFHDRLFENQRSLAPELYQSIAKDLGLDLGKFQASMASGAGKARIEEDEKQGAAAGVNGTPALFIDCRLVSGAYPLESLKPILDEEQKKASELAAQGKSGAALYEALCDQNVKKYPGPQAPAQAAAPTVLPGGRAAVQVRADDPVRGPASAKVVVVEFSDFQCPYCSGAVPVVKELETAHPTDVRVVWKHFPLNFHSNAMPAALAAEAARAQGGAAKFWAMHDALFAHQRELSPALYESTARELGLDLKRFARDQADPALKARVEEDIAFGQKIGVGGTPTFFVNGEKVVGANAVKVAVEKALAAPIAEAPTAAAAPARPLRPAPAPQRQRAP